MYCVQNKIYCGFSNESHIAIIYPNQSKSQGHVNTDVKDH